MASQAVWSPFPYGSAFLPDTEEVTSDPGSLQSINSSTAKGDFNKKPRE